MQSLIKARDTAFSQNYFPGGLTHTWVTYYEVNLNSDQSCINEWNWMEDLESQRKDIMSADLEYVVTSLKIVSVANTSVVTEPLCKDHLKHFSSGKPGKVVGNTFSAF